MHDYLIIGHGLAGTLLSQELIERGNKVLVLDLERDNSASKVAAGLYNPFTGRKMNKTWLANQLFATLPSYYQGVEQTLKTNILHDIGIYRPFFAIEQQNDWNAKSTDDSFIKMVSNHPHSSHKFKDEFGGLYLKNAGYVDVKGLIAAHKNSLIDRGCYREGVFHKSQLKLTNDKVIYDRMTFKRLIFCVGVSQQSLPYFDWLPFRPVKGEIYDFKLNVEVKTIVNRGVFILPKAKGIYRVGATYDWKNLNELTTESAKLELTEKMEALYLGKHKVIGGEAAIRPATKDRRPFIGQHPKYTQLYVFNGFGSKGVSMIPYFSKKFADCLNTGQSVEKEVNISRYFSLHYNK